MSKKRNSKNTDASNTSESTAPTETKEQTLARLAGKRMPVAVAALRNLGNLAGYKPTPEQTARIVGALRTEVDNLEQSLLSGRKSGMAFSLIAE